jgi:uncharacterized protein YcbK (DUF882 family)
MKDISELNPHKYPTVPNVDKNLQTLFERLVEFQDAWKKDFVITSGLRSEAQQEGLIAAGKSTAHASKHIAGAAADILDEDGSLAEFVKSNLPLMQKIGFWMEEFSHTKGWVHVQIMPPGSGNRVFIP